MGSIYKRGKNWYLNIRVKGRRIRRKIGSSKKIAELALKDAEIKVARDQFGFSKDDLAIDTFFERFLEYDRVNHQPRTTNRYRAAIDHFQRFVEALPNVMFLSEVSTELVDRYKVYRKDSWVHPNGQAVESDDDVNSHTRKGARTHTINFEVGVPRTFSIWRLSGVILEKTPPRA